MKYFLKTYQFGTVKDGKLDYGVYEISSKEYNGAGSSIPEIKLKCSIEGKPCLRHNACRIFADSIPEDLNLAMTRTYHDMICSINTAKQIDLITVEFGDTIFVRYCRLGQWYGFADKNKIDLIDQTKWGDKLNYFAIWDGKHWVKPGEYDMEPLSTDVID